MENADRKRELGNFRITIGDVHSHRVCRSFLGDDKDQRRKPRREAEFT